jgi:hypothetical protein
VIFLSELAPPPLVLCHGGDLRGYTWPCLRMVSWWFEDIPLVVWGLWQSGWGSILHVWPRPGVSSDRATVSPDPSCLSLQNLCCNSVCVGGLGSVCYIWSIYPVLFGVLCEFKCVNLSMLSLILSLSLSLFLSEELSPRTMPQDYVA